MNKSYLGRNPANQFVGGFNPLEKHESNWIIPHVGLKIKNIGNHHLVIGKFRFFAKVLDLPGGYDLEDRPSKWLVTPPFLRKAIWKGSRNSRSWGINDPHESWPLTKSHRIHGKWYIYLHLVDFDGTCRWRYQSHLRRENCRLTYLGPRSTGQSSLSGVGSLKNPKGFFSKCVCFFERKRIWHEFDWFCNFTTVFSNI